ncbi:phage major capsid protein, P2 family [Escherichia coli]|nr:phage major capsid protein, P2 family [Escherichia coli]
MARLSLSREGRDSLERYMIQQASLAGITTERLGKTFNVDPSIQQKMENAIKESAGLLQEINFIGVDDQEGEKVLIDTSGTIASTNATSDGVKRRNPASVADLAARRYRCEQVNYDTFISYAQIDAWSSQKNFQQLLSAQITRQIALDRIMIGFNGESHALISDRATNPLLQDVNPGWLKHIRDKAATRVVKGMTLTRRDDENKLVAKGDYGNPDAMVHDIRSSVLDEWHKDAPDLVVLMGRDLFNTLRLPMINAISTTNPNTELVAGQLIVASRTVGGLQTYLAPYFPKEAMLITSLKNLSIYFQKGSLRRFIREEPEYNRIATYQSMNDCYVVEDYGKCALIEGITFAGEDPDNNAESGQPQPEA